MHVALNSLLIHFYHLVMLGYTAFMLFLLTWGACSFNGAPVMSPPHTLLVVIISGALLSDFLSKPSHYIRLLILMGVFT